MIDLNNIVAKEGIGEGGNWKVYRCLLQDCSSVIVKESKGFVDMAIKGSIKKYQLVKALDIPTTSFLEVSSLDGKSVLVTEDLNSDNLCFVSWRKRSIPTHSERHNPPTIIAKMGLKRA